MMVSPFSRRQLCKNKPGYKARRKVIGSDAKYKKQRVHGGMGNCPSIKCRAFSLNMIMGWSWA